MKKVIYILLFLFPLLAQAQQDRFRWRVGFQSGVMSYYGDLNSRFLPANSELVDKKWDFLSHSVSIERNFSTASALRLTLGKGQFIANDRAIDFGGGLLPNSANFGRSLNVRTEIEDVSLQYLYYFDNDRFFGKKAFFAPYVGVGLGITRFTPFADLLSASGNRYYYWADQTVRDMPEGSAGASIIEQDGNYETALTGIDTEGVDYKTYAWHLAATFGFKIRLASRLNLNLEYVAKYTNTDYLDDVGGEFQNFPNSFRDYANNPADSDGERNSATRWNDIYSTLSVGLHYSLGKRENAFKTPQIYTTAPSSKTGGKVPDVVAKAKDATVAKKNELGSESDSAKSGVTKLKIFTSDSNSASLVEKNRLKQILADADSAKNMGKSTVVLKSEEKKQEQLFPENWGEYRYHDKIGYVFFDSLGKQPMGNEMIKVDVGTPKTVGDTGNAKLATKPDDISEPIGSEDFVVFSVSPVVKDTVVKVAVPADKKTEIEKAIKEKKNKSDDVKSEETSFSVVPVVVESKSDSLQINVNVNSVDSLGKAGLDSASVALDSLSAGLLSGKDLIQMRQDVAVLKAQMEMVVLMQQQQATIAKMQAELQALNQKLGKDNEPKKSTTPNLEMESLKRQLAELTGKYDALKAGKTEAKEEKTKAELAELELYKSTVLYFRTNAWKLSAEDATKLTALATYLKGTDYQVGLRGYTDKVGNAMYNQQLAMKRANAVRDFLVSQGISTSRITIDYAAPDQNMGAVDASYGRRVEIELGN